MNIGKNNDCLYCSDNLRKYHEDNYESTLNTHLDQRKNNKVEVHKSDFNILMNSPNNHQEYHTETNVNYKNNKINSKDHFSGISDRKVSAEKKIEKTIFDKNNHMSQMTETAKVSNISQRVLHSSMGSFRQSNSSHSKPVYEVMTFQRNFGNYESKKKQNNTVTIEHFVSPSVQRSLNKKKVLIPMLKTNKAYDISFTLDSRPGGNDNYNSWDKSKGGKVNYIEYTHRNNSLNHSKSSSKLLLTNHKLLQTGNSLQKRTTHSLTHSNGLVNDLHDHVHDHAESSRRIYNDEANKNVYEKVELIEKKTNQNENISSLARAKIIGLDDVKGHQDHVDHNAMKSSESTISYSAARESNNYSELNDVKGHQDHVDHNAMKSSESTHSYSAARRSTNNSELNDVKEYMIIEFPDGHHEKRNFRKEVNEDGDVNYIDIKDGLILKTDNASWKLGEEFVKYKKGHKKIRYEWRKDPGTDEWIKYNAETNVKLRSGDWKSGSEWIKTSDGKFVERSYKYTKNDNGQWIKVDPLNSNVLEFSTSLSLNEHEWIPTKNSNRKNLKNKKWEKREYTYEQNNKGKWVKIDLNTKKKIGKPTKLGWRQGIDYHMDPNGKVKKVNYIWGNKEGELMEKVDKKTRLPVNSAWKEGKETIITGDAKTTKVFAWVKIANKKWVKIDQETGTPLTNKIKSSQISSQALSNQTTKKETKSHSK